MTCICICALSKVKAESLTFGCPRHKQLAASRHERGFKTGRREAGCRGLMWRIILHRFCLRCFLDPGYVYRSWLTFFFFKTIAEDGSHHQICVFAGPGVTFLLICCSSSISWWGHRVVFRALLVGLGNFLYQILGVDGKVGNARRHRYSGVSVFQLFFFFKSVCVLPEHFSEVTDLTVVSKSFSYQCYMHVCVRVMASSFLGRKKKCKSTKP